MKPVCIEDYFRRSGDEKIIKGHTIENEQGFMSYLIDGDTFIGLHVYGDGHYWNKEADRIAGQNGCIKIRMATRRNPAPWKRLFDFNVIGYVLEREVK